MLHDPRVIGALLAADLTTSSNIPPDDILGIWIPSGKIR
jgi:hypothetical protein